MFSNTNFLYHYLHIVVVGAAVNATTSIIVALMPLVFMLTATLSLWLVPLKHRYTASGCDSRCRWCRYWRLPLPLSLPFNPIRWSEYHVGSVIAVAHPMCVNLQLAQHKYPEFRKKLYCVCVCKISMYTHFYVAAMHISPAMNRHAHYLQITDLASAYDSCHWARELNKSLDYLIRTQIATISRKKEEKQIVQEIITIF